MGATERVIQYIDYKGISKYKFCKDLGFSNKFLDNSSNMGTDKACKILHYFPDINPEWLLTGKGGMIKNNNEIQVLNHNRKTIDSLLEQQEVPLYDLEATAGLLELFNSGIPNRVLDTIKIPNLPKCDGAITVTGDSMYPLLKSGDTVLYKQTNIDSIFFGEMYLLSVSQDDWEEYITVKYIQKSEKGEEWVKLVSQNQHHSPKDIKITTIRALALIKASIRINTMM